MQLPTAPLPRIVREAVVAELAAEGNSSREWASDRLKDLERDAGGFWLDHELNRLGRRVVARMLRGQAWVVFDGPTQAVIVPKEVDSMLDDLLPVPPASRFPLLRRYLA